VQQQNIRITRLVDSPEATPVLARWFVEELFPWYGPDGQGNAKGDLAACRSKNELPICMVALGIDETVLGTVFLKEDSVGSELGVGPWLAALLVAPNQRARGIGTMLIEAIERQARDMGFDVIYVSTDSARPVFTRLEWEPFGSSDSLRGPVTVLRRWL